MSKRISTRSVLVVDDDPLIRWSVAQMLASNGYVVTEAGDCKMALAALTTAAKPFGVILLDYRLPDSRNLDLLRSIQSLSPTSRVIVMTGEVDPDLAQRAASLGAYRMVTKPFDMDALAALINRAYLG